LSTGAGCKLTYDVIFAPLLKKGQPRCNKMEDKKEPLNFIARAAADYIENSDGPAGY
jgi:hypothetical protein